jgi:hypothetical protein
MGANIALNDPIVCSYERCGTGDIAAILVAPFWIFIVGGLVAATLRTALRPERRRIRKALSVGVPVTFAIAALAVIVQVARFARTPGPQAYFDRLPTVAHFAAVPLPAPTASEETADPEPTRTFVESQGGVELTRVCGVRTRSCRVRARFARNDVSDGFRFSFATDAIRVLRDEVSHTFVFVFEDRPGRSYHRFADGTVQPARGYFAAAYDWQRRGLVTVSPRSIARHTAAPAGWTLGALLGLLFAGFLASTTRRARAAMRADLERFREGYLGTDGTLTFDDGRAPVQLGASEDFGAVMVLADGGIEHAHYRDDGQRALHSIVFGTHEHLRTAAREVLWGRAMYALAVLLLTAAPLVAFTCAQIP